MDKKIIDCIINKSNPNDINSRYNSYDHCRKSFLDYRNDTKMHNYITLHLYAYLASWGMLRNSFLMHRDYLFNKPVVKILCNKKYSHLVDFDPFKNDVSSELDDIIDLRREIKS